MYTLSNSIEGPKRRNVPILLRQLAAKHKVDLTDLTTYDVEHDFLDRLLGVKREYIQFTAESKNKLLLEDFWNELQSLLK
jgi:hypothetical protein